MLSGLQAILLCRGDLPWERQAAVAEPYARRKGYQMRSVTHSEEDAVVLARLLARTGHQPLVLALMAGENDRRLALLLEDVGARLEYCRTQRPPKPGQLQPESNTEDLVIGMYRREVTTGSISAVLKVPVGRVRAILDRLRPRPGYHRR